MSRTRLVLVVLLALVVMCVAPFLGPALEGDSAEFVLWQLRVPRVLVGALVGATLSVVGAAYQVLFGNPLATPSTVGTTAGASLGALTAFLLIDPWLAGGSVAELSAFVGAGLITGAVMAVAASRRAVVEDVLLMGIALTLATGAVTMGLQVRADMASTFRAVRWSLGSLGQVGYRNALVLLPFVVVSLGVLFRQLRGFDALLGGEDKASSLGVDVVELRTMVLGAGALGVGASVAVVGPIAFVGLLVPQLVRLTLGASRRILLPMSAVIGAVFLVVCDVLARVIVPGAEIPVGVLTAGIGGPAMVLMILARR